MLKLEEFEQPRAHADRAFAIALLLLRSSIKGRSIEKVALPSRVLEPVHFPMAAIAESDARQLHAVLVSTVRPFISLQKVRCTGRTGHCLGRAVAETALPY
jgi:hypothetical protein